MCRQNIHTKVTVICFVLLLLAVPIFSASGDFHNVHIGYTIFGYKSYEELNKALNPLGIENYDNTTLSAYYLLSNASQLAIDFTNAKQLTSDEETQLYRNTKERYNKSGNILPDARSFEITDYEHRNVCHQGFDHIYTDAFGSVNDERNRRWLKVGRPVLINAAKAAFSTDTVTAEFIAMITYYTHMVADLAEGNSNCMKSLKSFKGLVDELLLKISTYGNKLMNTEFVSSLSSELSQIAFPMNHIGAMNLPISERLANAKTILSALASFVPQIISNNTGNRYQLVLKPDTKAFVLFVN